MSEHPGLEFAPQMPRSQILPSMSPLVLFIISMLATLTCTVYVGAQSAHAIPLASVMHIFYQKKDREIQNFGS